MNVLLAASSTPPTAPRALRSSRPSGLRVPPCAAPGPLSRAGRKGAAPGAAQAPGRAVVAMALGDGEASDSAAEEQLLADIARMRAKEGIPEGADVRAASRTQEEGGLKQTIEKVLIADFFFICFGLLMLVVAVALNSNGNDGPYKLWASLWDYVWQPALGVLMLGALVVGVVLPKLSGGNE
mmetsp:Transcript_40973/g.130956  ORF Transcript_40973/g.130956 Transcript_40973/m.130956 type:complete len:182 (+) Transcript_40973:2-547(+)